MTENTDLLTTTGAEGKMTKTIKKAKTPSRRSRNDVVQSYDKSKRPHRVPLSEQKKIHIKEDDGYVYHLFNDTGNRIKKAELGGWEKVSDKAMDEYRGLSNPDQLGTCASQSVGNGITGYYMRIPKELYEQDQELKVRKTEETVKSVAGTELKDTPKNQEYGSLNMRIGE